MNIIYFIVMVRFQIFHFDSIRCAAKKFAIRFDPIDVPTGRRCAGITQHACHGKRREPPNGHCVASNYVAHFTCLDHHTYTKPNYAARLIRSKRTPSLRRQDTVASNYVVIYIL